MRHAIRFLGLTTLLCLLGALALPHAHATVMVAVPLEELVATSDAIVHARVVRVGTRLVLGDDGSMTPHTLSELRVDEWLRGAPLDGNDVVVDEIGGDYPGGGMRIDGTPTYVEDTEVIAFLSRVDGRWRTRGMVQGLFVVRPAVPGADTMVVRDTSDVGFASWEGGPMTIEHGGHEEMQLAAFLDWIRATTAQLELGVTIAPGTTSSTGGGL
jgi:hypothetical protein